jgi:hypothetical protein
MRRATPQALAEHSLIMTKDEQVWKRALGAKDDKLPVVVVLDSAGNSLWTFAGLASDQAWREIKNHLPGN